VERRVPELTDTGIASLVTMQPIEPPTIADMAALPSWWRPLEAKSFVASAIQQTLTHVAIEFADSDWT